ncbi:MAG: MerR family transcriptional regulator [Nitrospirae bacterium]|nr:MerR family transcriptional regulator [Nitrospirota bacterium]
MTERQLTYWRKTGLLCPTAHTAGGHARYSFHDLIALKAAKRLIDAGVSVQRMRKVIVSLVRFLPTIDQPLSEVSLVATGDVVLVFHRGVAFEAITGQEWVLPIAELQRDVVRDRAANPIPVQEELFPAWPVANGEGGGRTGNRAVS